MTLLRSLIFNILFFASTAAMALFVLPLLAGPPAMMQRTGAVWSALMIRLLRAVSGTGWEVRGAEHLPDRPVILAVKHQSAWDTLFFPAYLGNPAMVAKTELRWIPFYGWYAWRAGTVWVDRSHGPGALRRLVGGAEAALAQGRSIVVFPQGTRTAPGESRAYQPGIAALYRWTDAPIIPVALNSGMFWGRRSVLRQPGTIIVEFLPAMPRGLDRKAFLSELAQRVDTATHRLEAEARSEGP